MMNWYMLCQIFGLTYSAIYDITCPLGIEQSENRSPRYEHLHGCVFYNSMGDTDAVSIYVYTYIRVLNGCC